MLTDDDKRAAQSALPDNVRELYQQIIARGHIGENLTRQITQERFPDIEPDIQPEIACEQSIEPER